MQTEATRQLREAQERSRETIASLREKQETQVEANVQQEDPVAPVSTDDLTMMIGRLMGDGRIMLQFSYPVKQLIMTVDQAREMLNGLRETINNVEPIRRHRKRG